VSTRLLTTYALLTASLMVAATGHAADKNLRPRINAEKSPLTSNFYPTELKDRGIQGAVVVTSCVDDAGRLSKLPAVSQSSGHPDLDSAAVLWASQASYIPGMTDGKLASQCFSFRVRFEISEPVLPKSEAELPRYLADVVKESKPKLPITLSTDVRVDNIRLTNPTSIEYTYTFTNFGNNKADDARFDAVATNIEKNSAPELCGAAGFENIINVGATVLVSFQNAKGSPITTLTLDKDFCSNVLASAKKRLGIETAVTAASHTAPITLLRPPRNESDSQIQWKIDPSIFSTNAVIALFADTDGKPYVNVSVAWLRTLHTVHEKLAAAGGVAAPCLALNSNPGINAYASVSKDEIGCVGFTLGMLEFLENDPGQIAAVMAHELGHLKYRHTGRQDRQAAASILGSILGSFVGGQIANQITSTLASQAAKYATRAVLFSFDRDQEREADLYALNLLQTAGYDQAAFGKFMTRLSVRPGANDGGLFATHPSYQERISNASKESSQ
jgi:TonB family protein